MIVVVIIGIAVFQAVDMEKIYSTLQEERPMLLNALMPAALMAVFNNLLFGLGEVFHSNVWWRRAFAMRDKVGTKRSEENTSEIQSLMRLSYDGYCLKTQQSKLTTQ